MTKAKKIKWSPDEDTHDEQEAKERNKVQIRNEGQRRKLKESAFSEDNAKLLATDVVVPSSFPSLKGKEHYITYFNTGNVPTEKILTGILTRKPRVITRKLCPEPNKFEGVTRNIVKGTKVYDEIDVEACCIDKQVVRQVIEETWNKRKQTTQKIMLITDFKEALLKEFERLKL